jgi:hypothetical protein
VLTVRSTHRDTRLGNTGFRVLLVALSSLTTQHARAESCASTSGCFDANSLWLPAGQTEFVTLPSTRADAPGKMSVGLATELLHDPVVVHVASPDAGGRDVHIVDYALDTSLLFDVGALENLDLSLVLPTRLYQSGAGAGGISSQSAPPVEQSALRDPRLGVAYSLDSALARPGLGLRLALDVSVPLGNEAAFAGERTLAAAPSATLGWQISRLALRLGLGARLRGSAEFGDVRLGNQGFVGLGAGVDLLARGLLFLSLEGFGLPPLGSSRASAADSTVTGVTLFPAEWLFAVHSSFRPDDEWSLSGSIGTGLPFSSETRATSNGSSTAHFLGVTEPAWRTLLALRFAPR